VSLDRLVARQAGVVTLRQAVGCGLSAATVQRRAREGSWERLYPAVYLVGDESAVSGPAAAYWHGLLERAPDEIEVTDPRRFARGARPGVRVRRRDLFNADLMGMATADRADSAAERLLVRIVREAGLSGWVLGHPFGSWRTDLAFPQQKAHPGPDMATSRSCTVDRTLSCYASRQWRTDELVDDQRGLAVERRGMRVGALVRVRGGASALASLSRSRAPVAIWRKGTRTVVSGTGSLLTTGMSL
jgi:putative AbiEi antitoxin of type IV toxin-antitoxin system